jgi:hypothetical protein
MLQTLASRIDQRAEQLGITVDEDSTADALASIVDNHSKLKVQHDYTIDSGSKLNVLKQGDVAGTLPQVHTTN